jgi:hypothetical protein
MDAGVANSPPSSLAGVDNGIRNQRYWIHKKLQASKGRDCLCRDASYLCRFQFLEVRRMNAIRTLSATAILLLFCIGNLSGQDTPAASPTVNQAVNPALAPPNLLVLVRQEILYGKAAARQKLQVAATRISNRIEVPSSWIDLQSVTGSRQVLFFDPYGSFDEFEQSSAAWGQVYTGHPDLAKMQEDIDALLKSEDTTIAVRRDDLGYLVDHIDLSAIRFMRMVEVHVLPGHERDFVEASTILGDAYQKLGEDTPWVVYQVEFGAESPIFLTFMPMAALSQNDDLLTWEGDLRKAEGEEGERRLEQIAREAYVSTKSSLYAVSPEMSHVSKDVAAADPNFWTPAPAIATNRAGAKGNLTPAAGEAATKPSPLKISDQKQNQ